jgi:hypothetical protein
VPGPSLAVAPRAAGPQLPRLNPSSAGDLHRDLLTHQLLLNPSSAGDLHRDLLTHQLLLNPSSVRPTVAPSQLSRSLVLQAARPRPPSRLWATRLVAVRLLLQLPSP